MSLETEPSISAAVTIPPPPEPDPPPSKSIAPSGFLWSNLFADPISSNAPSSSPTYLPDGTPVVLAPPSVILKASSTWAGHLLCRFLGEPPAPAKFFKDLNRIWGKNGDISVRRFSSGTFLVFVPSVATRKWILQTGLWSSGMVSFIASEWSVNASLAAPPRLTSATTLLTIRDIPPQLWSHEAVARIAGGVAKLIPDTRAFLPRSSLGTATIRAIVPLGVSLPPSVLVKDSNGGSVLVSVDYGKLPPLCPNCSSYGHQLHRCPMKSPTQAENCITKVPTPNSVINSLNSHVPDSQAANNPLSPNAIVELDDGLEMDVDGSTATELPQEQTLPSSVKSPPIMSQVSPGARENVPMLRLPQLKGTNSSESYTHIASTVDEFEMEVDGSHSVTEPTSAMTLPKDPPKSTKSEDTSEMQTTMVPSLLETPAEQVSISNSPTHDLMLPESLDTLVTPITPCASSTSQGENQIKTIPVVAEQSDFSFPPPLSSALTPVVESSTDPSPIPTSSSECSQVQLQINTLSSVKKAGNRDKRKVTFDSKASLRCNQVSHQFKPKGVKEKRRKKINNGLVPSDEEVHGCLFELESDKVNTLYFEALEGHKILRKIESENQEEGLT